jgi:hypothetical protein
MDRTRRRLKELEAVVTTSRDLEAEIERARNVLKGEIAVSAWGETERRGHSLRF